MQWGLTFVVYPLKLEKLYRGLEYSCCIRAIVLVVFYRCTAGNYRTLMSQMLLGNAFVFIDKRAKILRAGSDFRNNFEFSSFSSFLPFRMSAAEQVKVCLQRN